MGRLGRLGSAAATVIVVMGLFTLAAREGSAARVLTGAGDDTAVTPSTSSTTVGATTSIPTSSTTTVSPPPPSTTTSPPSTTTTTSLPAPSTQGTAPSPQPSAPTRAVEQLSGSYAGNESFRLFTGRCPFLDHGLDVTVDLGDGTRWTKHSDYCGDIHGDLWTGAGTFTYRAGSDGSTLTGEFTDSATLPSTGEPYDEKITGGTGRYVGATGTCHLDNHLEPIRFGEQRQFGTVSCTIYASAGHRTGAPSPA